MTRCEMAVLAVLVPATLIAGTLTVPDLSSPEKALESYMSLKRKGATLAEFERLTSKETFAIVSGLVGLASATGSKTDISEGMPPENRYANVTIAKKQVTEDRAVFQVKAKYNEQWLKQEGEEAKRMDMPQARIPANRPTGGQAVSDASPGEEVAYPYHINGEGFVSFLFVKQDGSWRFHKSYASNQPSDFTPLLKAKDLSGGFTMTVKPSSPSPPLPNVAPRQLLAGRHSGKEWRGLFTYHDAFFSNKDHYGVEVLEKKEPDEFKRYRVSKLKVTLPKKPGEYNLSPTLNVTFFEPPGQNRTATEGILKITRDGATYKVELIAHFDQDNDVRGYFTFTPPKGE